MSNESLIQQTTEYFRGNISTAIEMETTTQIYTNLNNNFKDVKSTALSLYDILIPTFGAIIILLNLAVVISSGLILKKGQQPRSTYLFLGNVAMTDLITGFAVVFGQLYPKTNRDHYVCSIQLGMIVSSTLASVYSVGLIAIDRFLYILHGIHYQQWVYPNRARLMIAGTWIIGCTIGFMPLFGWYGDTDNGRICWFIRLAPRNLIVLTVVAGVIPLLIVLILYTIILYHAIRNILKLQRASNNGHTDNPYSTRNIRMFRGRGPTSTSTVTEDSSTSNAQAENSGLFAKIFKKKPSSSVKSPNKWKAIKVVLFTTGSFFITWSPYFITCLIYVYQCEITGTVTKRCRNMQIIIASPLAILGFTNSLINPIIYAWWHKGFRTYVQKRVSIAVMKARRSIIAIDNFRFHTSHSHYTDSDANKTTSTTDTTSKSARNQVSSVEIENGNTRL